MKKLILISLSAVLLSACASNRDFAGMTFADIQFNQETGNVESILIRDGKESAEKNWSADLNAGTIEYSSSDVRAFEGQRIRNEVFQALVKEVPETADSITDKIMNILKLTR